MAITITLDALNGETPSTVEAKVRNLPANQGLNDNDMWTLIDAEVAAVAASQGSKFRKTIRHDASGNYQTPKGKK